MKMFTLVQLARYTSLAFAIGLLTGTAMVISLSEGLKPKPGQPAYVADQSGLSCLIFPDERKVVFRF